MNSKVFLTALGCRLNEAELQIWGKEFAAYGIGLTEQASEADLMVINTCAVTTEAARKSRQAIRKLHRNNEVAKLIVTGCYASLDAEVVRSILGVDLVVDNRDKAKLASMANELMDWKVMPDAATEPDASAIFKRQRERAFIKVQDGCRYRCTYCIVTVARGDEVSRSEQDIIDEVNRLVEAGIKEVVLAGVHVGGYGSDIGSSLYQLVKKLLAQTAIPRIRFASVEPWDLPDNFFELFANPRLMPHMHLPIQSGSNAVLRRMSRRCKREEFLQLVNRARQVNPQFNITTDIIVGFPGETEQDFEQSLQIVREAGFGHVHIFSFSPREGTKAARLPNQIDEQVKKMRSQQLHQVAAMEKLAQLKRQVASSGNVLVEGKGKLAADGSILWSGHTENYHKIEFALDAELDMSNQLVEIEVIDIDKENLKLIGKPKSQPKTNRLLVVEQH